MESYQDCFFNISFSIKETDLSYDQSISYIDKYKTIGFVS